jgi:pyruvate kinase
MSKTHIIATLGPSSHSPYMIQKLFDAGVDIFRLNFSHGSKDDHKARVETILSLLHTETRKPRILVDLQGPKIRITKTEKDIVYHYEEGEIFHLCPGEEVSTKNKVFVTYKNLCSEVFLHEKICINDGILTLKVISKEKDCLTVRTEKAGWLSSHKGVNFPESSLKTPAITKKDEEDLAFVLQNFGESIDFIALSFVRNKEDIVRIQEKIQKFPHISCISKIEKPEALENFGEILEASDGIMVARGDLGVETDLAKLPQYQKQCVLQAKKAKKFCIVATQMLESMREYAVPTRAEVLDIGNAVLDSADALMLSAETASGKYPYESVLMMKSIIDATEEYKSSLL